MISCNLIKLSFVWSFHKERCVEFSLTCSGTLKYSYRTKTVGIFNFVSLINNSVTTGFIFFILIISAIISSKTTNTLRFLPRLYSSNFF